MDITQCVNLLTTHDTTHWQLTTWQKLGKLLICSCSAVIYRDLQLICGDLQWFAVFRQTRNVHVAC